MSGGAATLINSILLAHPSYWFDEAASISMASRSLADMLATVQETDAVHAAYYFVLHFWGMVFGWSEWGTRSLSLLAFALGAAGFAVLATRWLHGSAPVWATVIFIICPGLSWTGIEARGYALALAGSVWATVCLDSALRRRGLWRWLGYFLLMVISALFFLYVPLILGLHAVMVWGAFRDRGNVSSDVAMLIPKRLPFIISVSGIFLVIIPFALFTFTQRGQISWIQYSWLNLTGKVILAQTFIGPRNMSDGVIASVLLGLAALALATSVFLVSFLLWGKRTQTDARRVLILGIAWWLVPTFIVYAISLFAIPLYTERYLCFATPGVCLILGAAIDSCARHRLRLVMVSVIFALVCAMLAATAFQRLEDSKAGDGYRKLAELSSSATFVLFIDPTSRSILISYPAQFDDAADILLFKDSVSSNTLFGVNKTDLTGWVPKGRVVMYYNTSYPEASEPYSAILKSASCEMNEHIEKPRFSGIGYSC